MNQRKIKLGTYKFTRDKNGVSHSHSDYKGHLSWNNKIEKKGMLGVEFDVVLIERCGIDRPKGEHEQTNNH